VVSVISEEAFEADGAQVIFAKSFDIFVPVDFAFGKVLIAI